MIVVMASLKAFQLTAARRRLAQLNHALFVPDMFQLTAARRRLDPPSKTNSSENPFQLTAARRRLGSALRKSVYHRSFNSQPPEGGWQVADNIFKARKEFQLTAARRRLATW